MKKRAGESSVKHLRANRFYQIANRWYFSTRENLQVGPFKNFDDADVALGLFLRRTKEGVFAINAYRLAANI